jgi:hypothetical protein
VRGEDEIGAKVRRVRRAKAGDWIPTGCRRISRHGRVGRVIARGDVEEILGVAGGIGADLVQGRVSKPETPTKGRRQLRPIVSIDDLPSVPLSLVARDLAFGLTAVAQDSNRNPPMWTCI